MRAGRSGRGGARHGGRGRLLEGRGTAGTGPRRRRLRRGRRHGGPHLPGRTRPFFADHPGTAGYPPRPHRLLALVSQDCPGALRRALDAGASGFVCKDALPEQLVRGIRRVADGERFVDNALAQTLLRASEVPLSQRELTVLSAAAEGAPVPEIARRLGLSTGTVRNYMSAITRKTGARNRVDAIRISQGAGWL
ncbi:response regulator transcription factor [Streptomyces albus]